MLKVHWTPDYVAAGARQEIDCTLNPEAPWIPVSARAWRERNLTGGERKTTGVGRRTVSRRPGAAPLAVMAGTLER